MRWILSVSYHHQNLFSHIHIVLRIVSFLLLQNAIKWCVSSVFTHCMPHIKRERANKIIINHKETRIESKGLLINNTSESQNFWETLKKSKLLWSPVHIIVHPLHGQRSWSIIISGSGWASFISSSISALASSSFSLSTLFPLTSLQSCLKMEIGSTNVMNYEPWHPWDTACHQRFWVHCWDHVLDDHRG